MFGKPTYQDLAAWSPDNFRVADDPLGSHFSSLGLGVKVVVHVRPRREADDFRLFRTVGRRLFLAKQHELVYTRQCYNLASYHPKVLLTYNYLL